MAQKRSASLLSEKLAKAQENFAKNNCDTSNCKTNMGKIMEEINKIQSETYEEEIRSKRRRYDVTQSVPSEIFREIFQFLNSNNEIDKCELVSNKWQNILNLSTHILPKWPCSTLKIGYFHQVSDTNHMDMYICRQTKDTFVNNPNSIFSKYLKPEPICISSKGKIKEGYVNLLKKCTFERLLVIESVILMDRIRGLFEIFGQKISVQTLDFEIFGRETHLEDYFPAIFNYVTPRKIDIPLDCPEFYRVSTDISLLNLLTPANEIFLYLPVHAPANTSPWMYTIAFKKLVEESVKIQNVERFTIIQGEWKWNFYASMRQILKAFKEARDPSKMFQKYAFTMVEEMYFYDILKSRNFSFRVEDEVEICEHTRADQWSIKIMFSELKPEDADPHNLKVLIYKK